MDTVGAYSAGTYENRFGSWTEALQSAGYEPVKQHRISEDAILDEISRLATETGTPPTASEMRSKGKFTVTIAQDRFELERGVGGSWIRPSQAPSHY